MSQRQVNPLTPEYADLFELNPVFSTPEFAANVRAILHGNAPESLPFPHVSLDNFFAKPEALNTLRSELNQTPWEPHSNDLYSFMRTGELRMFNNAKYPALTAFSEFVKTTMRQILTEITGCELTEKVSVAGSRYDQTHVLLPHDDRMEERKFAFILYLSPEWKSSYGGDLNLFNSDERMEPTSVAKSITPKENTFLFFDIRPESWHSVSEVTAEGKSRLSLNGWFHCKVANINRNPAKLPPLNKLLPNEHTSLEAVQKWINPLWRHEPEQEAIKNVFAQRSEIKIKDFICPETYNAAIEELKTAKFNPIGPLNVVNVEQLDESSLAEDSCLKQLFTLTRSDAMTLLLTQWTGLHLFDTDILGIATVPNSSDDSLEEPPMKRSKPLDEPCTSKDATAVKNESPPPKNFDDIRVVTFLNKYKAGSYSLTDDRMAADPDRNGYCFDLLLFFKENPSKWNHKAGGFYSYIAANDPEEIVRVHPSSNVAALVFREPDVLNFTKYINCLAGDDEFYVFQATYFGFANDDSDSDVSESMENDFVENSRKYALCTGFSSGDDDEDVPLDHEPAPLVEHRQKARFPTPVDEVGEDSDEDEESDYEEEMPNVLVEKGSDGNTVGAQAENEEVADEEEEVEEAFVEREDVDELEDAEESEDEEFSESETNASSNQNQNGYVADNESDSSDASTSDSSDSSSSSDSESDSESIENVEPSIQGR